MKELYECEGCGKECEELFELGSMFVCRECFEEAEAIADYEYDRQREEGLFDDSQQGLPTVP